MLLRFGQSKRKNTRQQSRLQVRSDLKELNTVLHWYANFAQSLLSERNFWECQLALTEGFTNAVLHAHRGLAPETPIELKTSVLDQYLEIEIWDCGLAFDLARELHSIASQCADPLRERHRGLTLMHGCMDEVHYLRIDNEFNCLLMKKRLSEPSGG